MNLDDNNPFLQIIARSYEEITGTPAEYMEMSGGSDAASLHQAYGYTIPLMGSAETYGIYGADGNRERTNIEDWLTSIQYYMMTVVNTLS